MISEYRLSAVIFTIFVVTYFAVRAYWDRKAANKPVQEKKGFFLDRLNVVLVGVFTIVIPLIAVYSNLLSRFDYAPNRAAISGSIPFFIFGLFAFWRSHRDLGENWSATLEIKKEHDLVTNGIYKYIRHPMYLSIWFCCIGQALCIPNLIGGCGGLAAWTILYFARINKEEQMMLERFGDKYRSYMKQTKRVIPYVL
jgi:protein-S-isoprenylcysteine O-methyltransferase Ste14